MAIASKITVKPPTTSELLAKLDAANSDIAILREQLAEARKDAASYRTELLTVRAERDYLRKENGDLTQRAISDRAENARLGGKLEMLRELGTIPTTPIGDINVNYRR